MSDIIIIRPDTGEYLAANPPHPRSRAWDSVDFFTEDIENAQTFGTAIWANQYIHRCPPLCSFDDRDTRRDHEHIIVYAMSRSHVETRSYLPICIADVFRDFVK